MMGGGGGGGGTVHTHRTIQLAKKNVGDGGGRDKNPTIKDGDREMNSPK